MPNIVIPNTVINTSNEKFHAFWKVTRGLLAAGWKYKASADGVQKESGAVVVGERDASKDLWSAQGYVNLSQVSGGQIGTAASLLTVTNGFVTVQGLTGMTANSVGHALVVSGDVDSTDNGTFRIASFISASSVTIYNPSATTQAITNATNASPIVITVASTTNLATGEQVGISGVGGNTAANNIWTITVLTASTFSLTGSTGNGAYVGGTGVIGADPGNLAITWAEKWGGSAASVTSVLNGIATLTGLTGMTASSVGHRLTIINAATGGNNGTFLITAFVSATSVKIANASAAAGDGNNGSIQWTERDPAQDVYPGTITNAAGTGAWINLQGPSTMKFAIGTSVPSPAFVRGEKVTQAATGTEGEILGVVTDATGGNGFIVIAPRVNGSGANARGWDTSSIAAQSAPTGSGATVVPTAAGIEYIREIVIWKNNASTGHIYYQCIDQNTLTESATTASTGRFSTLANLGTATAIICPGGATGAPTINGFPIVGTLDVTGTGGTGAVGTGSADFTLENTVTAGMIQVICANNIESTGVSADGSFTVFIGTPGTSFTSFTLNGFIRCDDCEDGDVDPYVLFWPTNSASYARVRTGGAGASNAADLMTNTIVVAGSTSSPYLGFRRRGFATGDTFQEFGGWLQSEAGNVQFAISGNFQNPETLACTFTFPAPRIREPVWAVSTQIAQKMRKGTLRWWYLVGGGNATDTLDGKKWVQGSSTVSLASSAIVVGPWDGVSVPLQS